MTEKIKIGISKCLLGERVRYDGGHKLDRFLADNLGQFIEWIPICPEVECGLPVPRVAMDLYGKKEKPEIISNEGENLSDLMDRWTKQKLVELKKYNLSGFIFKSKSPSCGISDAGIYSENKTKYEKTAGIFTGAYMKTHPLVPVIDEKNIYDSASRNSFLDAVFAYIRWKNALEENKGGWLLDFHKRHKLIIMSHAPSKTAELGRIASDSKNYSMEVYNKYISLLMNVLKITATNKRNVNVLHHIFGYFKNDMSLWEKKELLALIDDYYNDLIPIIVPVSILKHYISKYKKEYLKEQYYLYQSPTEFKLRNIVW